MADETLVKRLVAIGLEEKVAKNTVANKKLAATMQLLLEEAGITDGAEKIIGLAIYQLATGLNHTDPIVAENRKTLVTYIKSKKIITTAQLDALIKYMKKTMKFDAKELEEACGVGVVVTHADIVRVVSETIAANKDALMKQRYRLAGQVLGDISKQLKWGDGKVVKEVFDSQLLALIGPKTEDDNKKVKQKKEETKEAPAAAAAAAESKPEEQKEMTMKELEEELEARDIPEARNTEEQLQRHLKATGGKVFTRFPPEPNGVLHLGHAKAMNFNFSIAKKAGGGCYMRFDDTNPEAEKKEFMDGILDNLNWLGHKPCDTTYSSDYFPQLYDLAVDMIKRGYGYICHQTAEEMQEYKDKKLPSPWRDRPIEESLRLFEDMRKGKFEEGKATLRMKGNLASPNPQMWDVVAYRIKYAPHPHVKDRWCIYPTYDYSHCLIDSLENITYSLCTLEFEIRRESYFWLLHILDMYKPKVWEYSRLNVAHNVMSKRRLLKMVDEGLVSGWDDPRLLTLAGLRRRGYTAEAINFFCEQVGVTRKANVIENDLLEFACRTKLDALSRRAMVVLDPIRVVLTNWPEKEVEQVKAFNFPPDESKGTHNVPLSKIVYIDRSDFKVEDSKGYYGLAPNKEVHLKYAYNVKCTKFVADADGKVTEIHCTVDKENKTKCKGKITWVSSLPGEKPNNVEVRLFDVLFTSKDPSKVGKTPDDKRHWIEDINFNSKTVLTASLADASLANAKVGDHFQFERLGFFVVDKDSTSSKLVFNRTVELKSGKKD